MNQVDQVELAGLSRGRDIASEAVRRTEVPLPGRRWKTRVLLPGGIAMITLGILGFAARDVLLPVTDVRVVPLIAKSGGVPAAEAGMLVQAPGWVEADPFTVAVSALADGVVDEVLVLEGDRVEAGQVVARLVDDDARIALAQTEARHAETQAQLESTHAMLREAEQNWANPIELTRRCEKVAAQLSEKRSELARWPSEVAREEAAAISLKADLDRVAPLHERGQASEIEFVHARQAYEVQQAELEKVRQRRPILEAQIAAIEADQVAARRQLELRIIDTRALGDAKAAVKRAEAAVAKAAAMRDSAALTLSRMEVRSPSAGIVMTRLAAPGSKLMLNMDNPQSAQAVRLYDPEKLQVRVDVPLSEAAKIGVGQRAEIIVDVLPDRVFAGRITRVVHEADVQKNTLQVKVAIENPISALKPEMLARARFLGESTSPATVRSDVLFAPATALRGEGDGAFVWLADQVAGVARRVNVKTGRRSDEGYVEICEGLRLGDRLIVESSATLKDGDRIRITGEAREARDGAD
ncbi:MAG: efflux RND transporter periplasmic adaptor subunit [Phycisphaerales bacterium]|nr:efflux RND transporter periplasmic adaptor subunit [Phycisphaerales bacterium]MCB9864236.1 efflux RND transporter periplasmic adaptor subunit [Phycisphaerales bacterium]